MSSKNTLIWFVVAAALFAFIFIFNYFLQPSVMGPSAILSGLQPSTVTSVQVIPANALEICADRTNGMWLLTKPVVYPAQPAAIETLLSTLQKLKPAIRISAGELRKQTNADAEYGFDPPRISLVIDGAGGHRWQLQVGNKTAPGDQVFLRVVGTGGAFVTDAAWLKYLPRSVNDWRDTALVNFNGFTPNWIILTNGAPHGGIIELHLNATNHLWRMTRPLEARADSARITKALQRLQTAHVAQFVTDDAKADLSAYGLQPANLDLWLGHGTDFVTAIHIGSSPTNDASLVYARRHNWSTILTTAKDPLSLWFSPVNDFRDPYLFDLSAPVAEIKVRGTNNFTLQKQGANGWRVVGQNFPVDTGSVQQFIKSLASLRVTEFVKDVVTKPDLPAYGLADPTEKITLFSAVDDTNAVIAQLLFGATHTNEVFVRRADEESVYAVSSEDFSQLPETGWQFRERRIWKFSAADVARITIHQNGETREMIHNGPNKWSLAPGSQGIINPPAIEETAYQLGHLSALADGWIAHDVTNAAPYGFKSGNLSITVALKDGKNDTVDFGRALPPETAFGAVTLDGKKWIFIFPPAPYQLISSYLTIPPPHGGVP